MWKILIHISSEPLLEHNQELIPLRIQSQLWPASSTWELHEYYVVSRKTGEAITKSSILVLKKDFRKQFYFIRYKSKQLRAIKWW